MIAYRMLLNALSEDGVDVKENVPLSAHTTFRVGGAARIGIFPTSEQEVAAALRAVKEADVPLFVLGGGSNLLAPDAGYPGAVLFTEGLRGIECEETEEGAILTAGAGVHLSLLARRAEELGLTGAEFLYGIPGTVGGAVVMNAGAYGGETAQILVSSRGIDRNDPLRIFERSLEEHCYGYRSSTYLDHPELLVLSARFALPRGDRAEISERMRTLLQQRKEKQPLEYPSAGSFFKRPVGTFAGKLIEDCGLKGYRIGGAEVSVKHAGFLINRGGATEADVRALSAYVRETVLRETGYLLESEVRVMEGTAP